MSGAAAEDFRPFADPDLSGLSNVEGLRETFSHTLSVCRRLTSKRVERKSAGPPGIPRLTEGPGILYDT